MRTKQVADYLPIVEAEPHLEPHTVTPYLPKIGQIEAEKHERNNRQPAFVAPSVIMPGTCPNCGGLLGVYLRLAGGGPYGTPSLGAPYTYYDGDGQWRKGWYRIDKTEAYWCPECQKDKYYANGTMVPTLKASAL